MNKFEFPTRKNFEQDFIFQDKILFTLKYKQATLQEFFDFYEKTPEDQFIELAEIIVEQIPYTLFQKILKKIFPWYRTAFQKAIDIEKVVKNIQANRFRIYESIFKEYDEKQAKKGTGKWFFATGLKQICSWYATSISEVMNTLTLEQFLYLSDGLRFEANEMSKEGKWINKYALRDTEGAKKRAEETRKAFNQK